VFASFFSAGFEGTTGLNAHGAWIDQVAATQHDRFADADYRRLRDVGIRGAREAVRWPLVDQAGCYDFSSLEPFVAAARTHGIDDAWDLFHFGYPRDVDVRTESFVERFAEYCFATAKVIAQETPGPWCFTPVNEPSYFAWAAGDAGLFGPHLRGEGYALKVQLARAAIAGVEAVHAACPDARILSVDAICRVVAPVDRPDLAADVRGFNDDVVYQSLDMLCGRREPELGGSSAHLGTIGINYYWTNQWELGGASGPLADHDPRRTPLRDIVRDAWRRYGCDVAISETAHVGDQRAAWLHEVAEEAEALLDDGVPLRGVCLYPILGMPEWHARDQWTRMGLWDLAPRNGSLVREPHAPMLEALRAAQSRHRLESGTLLER
jgi:hypothetical protein